MRFCYRWAGLARLARWPYLPLGFLVLAVLCDGCTKSSKTETAEISGKVMFKGKGLPGGRVTFVADAGGFAAGANIGEDGSYKITSAPVGPVHITVDNRMLEKKPRAPKGPILKRPDAEAPTPPQGHYVAIRQDYYSADKTPLTYTVKAGPQTYDVPVE
jgi:hypothetical protein